MSVTENDIQDSAIAVTQSILAVSYYDAKHLAAKRMSGGVSNYSFEISSKQKALWIVTLCKGFISHGLEKEAQIVAVSKLF